MGSLVDAKRRRQEKTQEGWNNVKFGLGNFWTVPKGAGMLHNITKPRPWRGRVQIRCEQEWKEHWQVDTAEQVTYDNL